MCKVAGVTKVNDANRTDVWLFMMILGEIMSTSNNDGLGYAAFNKQGKIFGEKWLYNKGAFTDFTRMKSLTTGMIRRIYQAIGDKVERDDAQAIILHTRMATCEKNIQNTHPFVNDVDHPTLAIIHNGVIRNDEMFLKKYSTCDSEVLVHLADEYRVADSLDNLRRFTKDLQGWYTVLGLTTDGEGRMVMDMYSDGTRLNSYYIPELNTRVFSTSAADIKTAAKECGMTVVEHWEISRNTALRIEVLTGDIISYAEIKDEAPEMDQFADESTWAEWLSRK